jgi:hypothetical protein
MRTFLIKYLPPPVHVIAFALIAAMIHCLLVPSHVAGIPTFDRWAMVVGLLVLAGATVCDLHDGPWRRRQED